ncbi:MAG: putative RNA polymerase [Prokaryotic dsDNA virus sp.]|nr:MAG: putative RNA polymerase [Prokaryotic dsDNA virus sp.]|tara:strand:- start:36394 stop:38892 length:2499 start_codon:yes stop_codon:yes gene_type:complete
MTPEKPEDESTPTAPTSGSVPPASQGSYTLRGKFDAASTQEQAEALMVGLGKQRSQKKVREAKFKAQETLTKAGGKLMRDLGTVLADAIKDWVAKAKSQPGPRHKAVALIENTNPNLLAAFTLRVVLDALSRERSHTATATAIANRVEDEFRYTEWAKKEPTLMTSWARRTANVTYPERRRIILREMADHGLECPRWDKKDRHSVGVVLLELCEQSCGIIEIYRERRGRKTKLMLRATQAALDWVEDVENRGELVSPLVLPFLEPPLDWVDPISGGFHSTEVFSNSIVKTNSKAYVRQLENAEMPDVYRAVNHLQQTQWQINQVVFETFDHLWSEGVEIAGLPSREQDEVPTRPESFELEEDRVRWRRFVAAIHTKNRKRAADRLATAKVHWVAERYREVPFWFAYQLDWRGRAYPVSSFLHPQGPDLVKSLLEFGVARPIQSDESKMWHKVHGANCWGKDKETFADRIKWVDENQDWILEIAEDPLASRQWVDADSPWQFLAWALDFHALHNDPHHESRLPIHQDATQSGIQIYSFLLRDEETAGMTNVTPTSRPADLYQSVIDEVVLRLKAENRSRTLKDLAEEWLAFGLDRGLAKRPVMTRVYNSTRHSARIYVQDWAEAKAKVTGVAYPQGRDDESSLWFLTMHVWEAMAGVLSASTRGQDWLSAVAKEFSKRDKSIWWTTPLGFPIRQWYPKFLTVNLKTRIGETLRQTSLIEELPQALGRRMLAGFAPNFIHSMDAAAMMLTVAKCRAKGVVSMACVHDSFATHAADADILALSTREAYAELFSQDLFDILRTELQQQIPDAILPPVPEMGTLDPKAVLESPYFFS